MSNEYFTYNGHSSSDYNLVIGGLDINNSIPLGMDRNILAGTMNRYRNSPNHMGTQYSGVLVLSISMVKDPCISPNQADMIFTEDEVNEITTWLTSPDYPMLFHMYNSSGIDENDQPIYTNNKYDYFGLFSSVELQTIDDQVIGFTMTFTTNAPYAWTEEIKIIASSREPEEGEEDTGTAIEFTVNTADPYREIYPLIKVTGVSTDEFDYDEETGEYTGSASAREIVTITNNNDNSVEYKYSSGGYIAEVTPRSITLEVPHMPVYIDSNKARIYDLVDVASRGMSHILNFEDLGLEDVSYIYWPRIFNGSNHWTITGNCDVEIIYREPRKVGGY